MTIEYASWLIRELYACGVYASIDMKPWPAAPFDREDTYLDFSIGTNLYASEKLSEITPDVFFRRVDLWVKTVSYTRYEELKTAVRRDWRLMEIGLRE